MNWKETFDNSWRVWHFNTLRKAQPMLSETLYEHFMRSIIAVNDDVSSRSYRDLESLYRIPLISVVTSGSSRSCPVQRKHPDYPNACRSQPRCSPLKRKHGTENNELIWQMRWNWKKSWKLKRHNLPFQFGCRNFHNHQWQSAHKFHWEAIEKAMDSSKELIRWLLCPHKTDGSQKTHRRNIRQA